MKLLFKPYFRYFSLLFVDKSDLANNKLIFNFFNEIESDALAKFVWKTTNAFPYILIVIKINSAHSLNTIQCSYIQI